MGDLMNITNRWEGRSACVPHKRRYKPNLNYPGLIRFYTMDSLSGSTLYDETKTGDATINNMASIAGLKGLALEGGLVVSVTRNIDLGSDVSFLSFSAWIRRMDLVNTSGVLFNANSNRTVQIRDYSNGNYVACYNGSLVNSNLAIADTNWHHLVGVIESTNNIRFYLDGLKASGTVAINSGVVRYFGRPYTIGSQEACCFDHLRLYNTMLSEMQVKELFDELR